MQKAILFSLLLLSFNSFGQDVLCEIIAKSKGMIPEVHLECQSEDDGNWYDIIANHNVNAICTDYQEDSILGCYEEFGAGSMVFLLGGQQVDIILNGARSTFTLP
jgi:hypothetical protein